ncbi:hypothetical protein C0J52_26214 [Blattella germanica]|nr:hypothetical protein C0J52_26214 [Blattella germanica]
MTMFQYLKIPHFQHFKNKLTRFMGVSNVSPGRFLHCDGWYTSISPTNFSEEETAGLVIVVVIIMIFRFGILQVLNIQLAFPYILHT